MNEVELKLLPCRRDDIKSIALQVMIVGLIKREAEFCHAIRAHISAPSRSGKPRASASASTGSQTG